MIYSRALSIGPAACAALTGAVALRVQGVFSSTVSLQIEGTRRYVALCGSRGTALPHAVVLERPEDLAACRLAEGARGRLVDGAIELPARPRTLFVDLAHAERPPSRMLPALPRLTTAHRACTSALAELQREEACDLRIDALARPGGATTLLGRSLGSAALGLCAAARARDVHALERATATLVGLGAGLTPSGDDFLCGFLAAARASGPALLVEALGAAAERNLGRTAAISAFLVRCAMEGFWPAPLVDLAEALARDREPEALVALAELCRLGHSSGRDIATGFLSGLEALAPAAPAWRPLRGRTTRAR